MKYTLGSLFDGSGGFPLAGSLCGITPVWASEVEPYPIAVTRSRFPGMNHLGDVSKVSGAEIEPVDIITFGSPCQDLSVAGKRAGLKHEANGDEETTRSGLFMEAVRIIKEMREKTNGVYPRFAVWENVPGAFSSNKGEDFRVVLEELIRIVEPSASVPPAPQNGWPYADAIVGDGWSLAYRTLDAQYIRTAQRRRRIYLVIDFRGECAHEIQFKRESLRGNPPSCGTPWQGTPCHAESRSGADDRAGEGSVRVLTPWDSQGNQVVDGTGDYVYPCIRGCGGGGYQQGYVFAEEPIAVATAQAGAEITENGVCPTITAAAGMSGNNQPWIAHAAGFKAGQSTGGIGYEEEKAQTLSAQCSGVEPTVVIESGGFCPEQSAKTRGIGWEEEQAPTLRAGVTPAMVIKETLPFDTTQVTSPQNGNNPQWGDPCHPLAATAHAPAVVAREASSMVVIDSIGGKSECATETPVSPLTGDHENRVTDYTSVVIEAKPCYCLQGNVIDRADTARCNGKGWKKDTCYTLNTIDRPAVTYTEAISLLGDKVAGTLKARDYKGIGRYDSLGSAVLVRHIVRRLTPTECARLQGFPDRWGEIDKKGDFTEEEYRFWLDVRRTYDSIVGKAVKDYTKDQVLNWYNKLHSDSAEYKMWGNGIALPTALYCMQGIAAALEQQEG